RLEKSAPEGAPQQVWMVHSGGFYAVAKQKSLGVPAAQVRWFRWEAAMTWLSGMVLLYLVYYSSSGLLDPDVANIAQSTGIVIGLAVIAGGWLIYDFAARTLLGNSAAGFAAFSLLMIAILSWGLLRVFSGRAAYIHLGAVLGTIMTANVWFRILPSQRKMIAAAASGAKFDATLGAQAKLRSKHNTFMAVAIAVSLLEALEGRRLPFAIEVAGFSDEEGVRFGVPFIGSRALVGRVDEELLAVHDQQGVSLRGAIEDFGLNPAEMPQAGMGGDYFAYVEFHIEQGPVLEDLGK